MGSSTSPLKVYLGWTGSLTVAYFLLPSQHMLLWGALGLTCAAAVGVGVRIHRPPSRLPWWLLALALLTFAAGDFTYNVLTLVLHEDNPFPSAADGFYLAMYPLCAGALALFIRARTPSTDRASLIDALIITVGLGLLSWVYLIEPFVSDDTLTWAQKLISISYPLGDVLLLAMIARLLAAGGLRSRSLLLLTLATTGLLVSDVLYGLIQLNGTWQVGGPVDVGWVCFYTLLGATALHPSMATMTRPIPLRPVEMRRARLLLVGAASLIAPVDWIVHALTGNPTDGLVHATFSIALFALVFARMSGVVRAQQLSNRWERALRLTGAELVAAGNPEQVRRAVGNALRTLTQNPRLQVCLAVRAGAVLASVEEDGWQLDLTDLSDEVLAVLAGTSGALVGEAVARPLLAAGLEPEAQVLLLPMRSSSDLIGVLLVLGEGEQLVLLRSSIETLGSSAALALERIRLAQDEHQRESEAHFRSLIQNSSDMILVVSDRNTITYQTPSVARVLGFQAEELAGLSLKGLMHPEDKERALQLVERVRQQPPGSEVQLDCRMQRADKRWVDTEVICSNLRHDPSVRGLVLTLRDVSERRELERELTRRAFHDGLTDLANRGLFADRLEHALRRGTRNSSLVALLFLDLDDFKAINDTRGHAVGDVVLVEVARILQLAVRSGDTAARLGGDEFALLIEDAGSVAEVKELAARVLAALREPLTVRGQTVFVRASIGIATNDHTQDPTELLQLADLALYEAKDAFKGGYRVFRDALRADLMGRLERCERIQQALELGHFALVYQPIVRLDTPGLVGLEALVRWHDPGRGIIPPDHFIADAEQSGLIVPLGTWVLREAVRQAHAWQLEQPDAPPLRLSVNVSARQVREPGFVATVAAILTESPVAPWTLVLELTESLLIEDDGITQTLAGLRELGILLALDDFGTGYSALGYLQRFPIDILKLDKSFVCDLLESTDRGALVEAIVQLARTLDLDLVVEGIESPAQSQQLQRMGCRYGQGFLYGRPQAAHDISRLIATEIAAPEGAPWLPRPRHGSAAAGTSSR